MLRVALPLVPYYRIESEAAVLSYLKENTSIPIARVIAWESSAAADLGFEWILLEKIEGVALYDIWRKVPWESKLEIVAALAPLLGQLWDHKFDRIGSLYFKGWESQSDPEYQSTIAIPTRDHLIETYKFLGSPKIPQQKKRPNIIAISLARSLTQYSFSIVVYTCLETEDHLELRMSGWQRR